MFEITASPITLSIPKTEPQDNSPMVLVWKQKALLQSKEGRLSIPTYSDIKSLFPSSVKFLPLGFYKGIPFYVLPLREPDMPELPEHLVYAPHSQFRTLEENEALLFSTAFHLQNWYRSHRYCGVCSNSLTAQTEQHCMRCEECNQLYFPTIAPAVIVAITDGDYILLAENAAYPGTFMSLIAGYVEAGETIEQAMHREAMEEVGLKLTNLRYLTNQPWGFGGSLMLAFHANADRNASLTLQVDEIIRAKWVRRDELPTHPYPISVAAKLIERFKNNEL